MVAAGIVRRLPAYGNVRQPAAKRKFVQRARRSDHGVFIFSRKSVSRGSAPRPILPAKIGEISMKSAALLAGVACAFAACSFAIAATATDALGPLGAPAQPAPLAAKPVTETFFGTKVTDEYRYFEALSPETLDWMKAQGNYTRSVL